MAADSVLYFGVIVVCLLEPSHGVMKDMTHLVDKNIPRYPGYPPMETTVLFSGPFSDEVPWVIAKEMQLAEHYGTHVDAPYHFDKEGKKLHEIPFGRWRGEAVVIDIEERAKKDKQANVTAADLELWEKMHGNIPDGAWILMHSGWSKYWPDQMEFVGTDNTSVPTYAFPGFSPDAAEWILANRPKISGIGVDTVSCDNGDRTVADHTVHVMLQPKDIMCIEMLKEVGDLPRSGATFFFMPLNLVNGTGSPGRAFAIWDDKELDTNDGNPLNKFYCDSGHELQPTGLTLILILILASML